MIVSSEPLVSLTLNLYVPAFSKTTSLKITSPVAPFFALATVVPVFESTKAKSNSPSRNSRPVNSFFKWNI